MLVACFLDDSTRTALPQIFLVPFHVPKGITRHQLFKGKFFRLGIVRVEIVWRLSDKEFSRWGRNFPGKIVQVQSCLVTICYIPHHVSIWLLQLYQTFYFKVGSVSFHETYLYILTQNYLWCILPHMACSISWGIYVLKQYQWFFPH